MASPPLLEAFAASPYLAQDDSPLLSCLPAEIRRQIYVEVWRTFGSDGDAASSLCPHIAATPLPGVFDTAQIMPDVRYLVAVPCMLPLHEPWMEETLDGPDDDEGAGPFARRKNRYAINEDDPLPPRNFPPTRFIHLGPTGWRGHQACQQYSDWIPRTAHLRPYLPLLTTCKRVYIEAIALLYSTLTFQFADASTAEVFLQRWPCVTSVRLYMRISSTMLDVCRQSGPSVVGGVGVGGGSGSGSNSSIPRGDGPGCAITPNGRPDEVAVPVWRRLCARIATLPRLRHLYVWAETGDLRAWHQIADEVRLFSGLFGVPRSERPPTVVLELPVLPSDPKERSQPPDCYLQEGHPNSSSRFPCIVYRTKRPDNWSQFLSGLSPRRRMSIGSSGLLPRTQAPPYWP